MTIASRALFACACVTSFAGVAACARGEPPHWTPDGATSEAKVLVPSPSEPSAAWPALPDAEAPRGAPDATPSKDPGGATPSRDASAQGDPGSLPQTRDPPKNDDPAFLAGVAALVDAVAEDDPERAMPFFFPLAAYKQVKDVGNPAGDWRARLVAAYERDIHALHAEVGPRAAGAHLGGGSVPVAGGRWVEPGEEYNKIGYYRVFNTEVRAEGAGGRPAFAIKIKSMISWRGRWYCVHLARVR